MTMRSQKNVMILKLLTVMINMNIKVYKTLDLGDFYILGQYAPEEANGPLMPK